MGGNKSTGMREMLVTPITSSTRQITTMKYGLRIENRGITFPNQLLLGVLLLVLHHRHDLWANFLTGLQSAAVTNHHLFAWV